ncbi:MAG: hypothetical protein RJB39_219 [Candidatus Parcubacteria bacterium]|jgi:hypothetical protein
MNIPPDILGYATSGADPKAVVGDDEAMVQELRRRIDEGATNIPAGALATWLQSKLGVVNGKELVLGMLRAHRLANAPD